MKRMTDFRFQISDCPSCRPGRRWAAGGDRLETHPTAADRLETYPTGAGGLYARRAARGDHDHRALASVSLAALAKTREVARLDATKATVAKLNNLVMQRYQSYMTRRLPINVAALNSKGLSQSAYAKLRMQAIRDLMRMEMPDHWCDIWSWCPGAGLQAPSLQRLYQSKVGKTAPVPIISGQVPLPVGDEFHSGSEDHVQRQRDRHRSRRRQLEHVPRRLGQPHRVPPLGPGRVTEPADARHTVVGRAKSTIPAGTNLHHDPFDPNFVEKNAYHLYPLIYAGVLGKTATGIDDYGIAVGNGVVPATMQRQPRRRTIRISAPVRGLARRGAVPAHGSVPLVHNHHMEQR